MDNTTEFDSVIFSREVIEEAFTIFKRINTKIKRFDSTRRIKRENKTWSFDNDEDFFSQLKDEYYSASFNYTIFPEGWHFNIHLFPGHSTTVKISSHRKEDIEYVLKPFEVSYTNYDKLDTNQIVIKNPSLCKNKSFENVKFSITKLQDVIKVFEQIVPDHNGISYSRYIDFGNESWYYDNDSEFFSDYLKDFYFYRYEVTYSLVNGGSYYFEMSQRSRTSALIVRGPDRSNIEKVFVELEKNIDDFAIPIPAVKKDITIFIGHGRSAQWKELKDHLSDKHDYKIESYETGARAGHTIRDILNEMLSKSSFAILVLTGEDLHENGDVSARPNVIHETGLFQGKLGFNRAIVLLEKGTDEFSNIHGIQQIRFSKDNIVETFGEVLATLKREFGNSN